MKTRREVELPQHEGCLGAVLRLTLWIAALGCLVAMTPLAYYYGYPLRDHSQPQRSDVIVLLSHGQIGDGWLSVEGAQRTLAALQLYKQGFAPIIISSGINKGLDQAGLQAKWLAIAGIPAEAILVERQSTRTYESAIEILKIIRTHRWQSAVVVTSQLDVPRVRAVFWKLGFYNISFQAVPEFNPPSGHFYYAAGWRALYHATYEYAGLILYKWRGWI